MPKRLTPQEKKRLSLQKDRREAYGQNDKASRRLVPLRKAQAQRRLRRGDKQLLADAITAPDQAEDIAATRRKPDWVKAPGITLEDEIRSAREGAERREGRRKRTPQEWVDWYRRFHGDAVAERMKVLFAARWGDVE